MPRTSFPLPSPKFHLTCDTYTTYIKTWKIFAEIIATKVREPSENNLALISNVPKQQYKSKSFVA